MNAGVLDAKVPGFFAGAHNMPDGTPSGRLVYINDVSDKYELAIYDPANLEKARVIGMTIESIRTGDTRVRGVTIGRAPFDHGKLNYGVKLYLPHISDGEPGVLTTASTSGIIVARAARGNWVYFYPFLSTSLA